MKCHVKIDVEQQHWLFRNFYDFSDWTKKTMYLRSCVDKKAVIGKLSELNPINQQKTRNHTYRFFYLIPLKTNKKFVTIFFINAFK